MSHLKLITNQRSPEDMQLIQQIDQYVLFFKDKKNKSPHQHDFSKHFLIFCYNYFELGLKEKAREMLSEIRPSYFRDQMLKDMESAVEHRNLADDWTRKRNHQKAREHQIEAEFFIVAAKIIPYLNREPSLLDNPAYLQFLTELKAKSFLIKISPYLDLISSQFEEIGEK